jgi:hypothetical protein
MTSAYKVASNRRNARQSTGPRTAGGKERVRLNALRHGLSSQTAVLPDEEAEAFAQHRDGLLASLKPRDDVELKLAETFVFATWKRERCVRAENGMIARRMERAELEESLKEHHEVISLGRRLFWDRRDDARLYPHSLTAFVDGQNTSRAKAPDDPNDPEHILIDLESTLTGCRWLLARWAELKDHLSPGLSWDAPDKLKAVRLLGKQPLDAADDPVVCLIFVASHVADARFDNPFYELEQEFECPSFDRQQFMKRLKERPWRALRPRDEADARHKLAELVDKSTARLEKILSAHEKRAARFAGKTASRLAFDPSDEAERLRRHERACVRDMFRSLGQLAKLRQGELLDDGDACQPDTPAYQPDAPAPEFSGSSQEVEAYKPDAPTYQPEAPARECLPLRGLPAVDWPSPTDPAPQVALPLPQQAAQADLDGATATADRCEFQNKPNAGYADHATCEGRSDGNVEWDEQQRDCGNAAGAPPPGAPDSSLLLCRSARIPETWISCSRRARMAKAAAALSRRRQVDRLQRKRWREENRRDKAERLERKRRREQAQGERDAAHLSGAGSATEGLR